MFSNWYYSIFRRKLSTIRKYVRFWNVFFSFFPLFFFSFYNLIKSRQRITKKMFAWFDHFWPTQKKTIVCLSYLHIKNKQLNKYDRSNKQNKNCNCRVYTTRKRSVHRLSIFYQLQLNRTSQYCLSQCYLNFKSLFTWHKPKKKKCYF